MIDGQRFILLDLHTTVLLLKSDGKVFSDYQARRPATIQLFIKRLSGERPEMKMSYADRHLYFLITSGLFFN